MPAPSKRSRSLKRIQRRVPSGRTVVHYKKKKHSKAICGSCGAVLQGVPRKNPLQMRKMPKTKKRPERPYGGVLCSKCTRDLIIKEARANK